VFEKWRLALLSNAASQLIDAYVQPVKPPVPHYTQKVAFIELGSCSVRAGILTNKPSLPQVFFPAVACLAEDSNEVFVGIDALKPENRRRGRLHRPIEGLDPASVERFHLNPRVIEAIVWKAIGDLKIDPSQYKVLLSISQDVPTSFIGQLLRLLINSIQFHEATIARQPSLILYSYDVTTGVVVDIGERLHIVPVIDEYIVDSAIVSLPFGAQQIRDLLKKRLHAQNNQLGGAENTPIEHIALQEIVKQACYVSTDPSTENQSVTKQVDLTPYSLGGGFSRISVSNE
jgi:actin-related protein